MEIVFHSRIMPVLPYVLLHLAWSFVFAGNALTFSVGHAFSTSDEDNDGGSTNCAQTYSSGWWFTSNCNSAAINDNEYNGNPLDT